MFGKLSWSHYLELLKCDDELEMQFYMTQAVQENWSTSNQQWFVPEICSALPIVFAEQGRVTRTTEPTDGKIK